MAETFKVLHSEFFIRSDFTKPAFSILNVLPSWYEGLFTSFSRFGVKLADIKIENASTLGEFQISFFMFDFNLAVRIRFDRLEIQGFNTARVSLSEGFEIFNILMETVASTVGETGYGSYETTRIYQGQPSRPPKEMQARFLPEASDLPGPLLGTGFVLYYGPKDDRISATITSDLSAAYRDGLYLKITAVWNDAVKASGLEVRFQNYTQEAFKALDLEILEQ